MWISPVQRTKNEIDHIASNDLDVRSYKGTNIDSDHYSEIVKI